MLMLVKMMEKMKMKMVSWSQAKPKGGWRAWWCYGVEGDDGEELRSMEWLFIKGQAGGELIVPETNIAHENPPF